MKIVPEISEERFDLLCPMYQNSIKCYVLLPKKLLERTQNKLHQLIKVKKIQLI